ncbi:MAG: 23S rRNA (pseudouridine(1915)-N(3))-methyltransferase RlmH [Myxococcota bacterium]|nr:23S rRNA (pseudouridine(1915)-N(3))-methyltransferase RlmH [Myxococcota bacterium]
MQFRLVSEGHGRADLTAPQTDDYLFRISKFFPIESIVLKPGQEKKNTERSIKVATTSDLVLALDEQGKMVDSDSFAKMVDAWMQSGISCISFFIGGASGLPAKVKQRADILLSLSPMTLPHRLARLLLAEQLYRALCQIRHIPYKK